MASSTTKRVFDVSKPGKSAPDATSRPVIVGNRSMVKDPILKQDEEPKPTSEVTPISGEAKTVEPPETKEESPQEAEAKIESEKTQDDPVPEQKEPELQDQDAENKKQQNEVSDAEKAKQDAVQKLIADGTYIVPIGKGRAKNARQVLQVITLVVIVGVIIVDLLIDTGVVKTSIKPVIDLIHN